MSRTRTQLVVATVSAVIALLPLVVVPAVAGGSSRPTVVAGPERCC